MKKEQIYTGCLAQGAYYIESNGEVAIIDPLREVKPYIDRAEKDAATIKYIFETHFHADFVSGHLTLSRQTGAPIIYGPNAEPAFDHVQAKDEQVFKLGDVTITAMHTPGHTMESTTYLLRDESGKDHAIFTGDTLFLGDVGRPDLAQKAGSITTEDLAGYLYNSLRMKIMPLADDVIVYPAHGAGSACGKNMMKVTVDTLGNQKKMNYALREDMTKEEFVKELTDGLEAPPSYFPHNVKLNKEGYSDIDQVIARSSKPLSVREFEVAAEETEALILDVRHQKDFVKGFVPRSIFIGLNGGFAPWVGALIKDIEQKILLVVDPGKEQEAITRLSRVGFDHVIGYLDGGFESWSEAGKEIDAMETIEAVELAELVSGDAQVDIVDVRKVGEYNSDHLVDAQHCPLSNLNDHMATLPSEGKFYIHCAGGYRSVIAASILKARGIHNHIDVLGGYKSIKETDLEREQSACTAS